MAVLIIMLIGVILLTVGVTFALVKLKADPDADIPNYIFFPLAVALYFALALVIAALISDLCGV